MRKIEDCKCVGSTVQSSGEVGEVVKKVCVSQLELVEASALLSERKVAAEMKGKVCKISTKPAMFVWFQDGATEEGTGGRAGESSLGMMMYDAVREDIQYKYISLSSITKASTSSTLIWP